MAPAVIEVGTVINERYEIRSSLGTGGFGVVWKAFDNNLNREVAIKRLTSKSLFYTVNKDEVLSEAQKIAQFAHPNIVSVFDILEFEGEPVIIMEYLAGGSLQDYLRKLSKENKWVTINESIRLIKGILKGLSVAHNCPAGAIIHKDLKPLNILFGHDREPKIVDFGLATVGVVPKVETGWTGKIEHEGTFGYKSPEQLKGMQMDQRSDLFNVGLITYLLLGSVHPFVDQRFLFDYKEMVFEPYRKLQAISFENAPETIGEFVFKLLEPDPEKRFQTADEAIENLDFIEDRIKLITEKRATEFLEQIRANTQPILLTAEEVAESVLNFRRRQQYENAVLLYEKSETDLSQLNEIAKANLDGEYQICKIRVEEQKKRNE